MCQWKCRHTHCITTGISLWLCKSNAARRVNLPPQTRHRGNPGFPWAQACNGCGELRRAGALSRPHRGAHFARNSGSTRGAGQASPRDHQEEPGAAGGYSTAAGTTRLRGSGPVALQHLARSRRLSPSIASPELKKKKKRSQWLRSPRAAAVVATAAGASTIGPRRSRSRAPCRQPCRESSSDAGAVAWVAGPKTCCLRGGERGRWLGACPSSLQSRAGERGGVGGGRRKRR